MSFHRLRSRRALRHVDQTTADHERDKQLGERRQATGFIPVPLAPSPSPKRDLSALRAWALRRYPDGRFVACRESGEYGNYLQAESKRRSWFHDSVRRKGKPCRMRREIATPLNDLIVSAAPWFSDCLHQLLRAGADPRPQLQRIVARWVRAIEPLVTVQRHWVGLSCHTDTDDLHFDVVVSRFDGEGGRIGDRALELGGPWLVGVDRQLRADAAISSHKARQFRSNMTRHQARYGDDAVPLDLALARALDEAAEAEMPELAEYRREYGRRVPELERAHLDRAVKNAKEAAEKLTQLAAHPEAEPNVSVFGHGTARGRASLDEI